MVFPGETYRYYGGVLLPELMRVFNWSEMRGELPPSMMESTIIVIPKEGKDPLNPASYRPIALLNSDTKILAKILAARLNKVIQKLVHSDQSGWYTSINIRWVFSDPSGSNG